MYGLILDAMSNAICRKYGEDVWLDIRKQAGINSTNFGE